MPKLFNFVQSFRLRTMKFRDHFLKRLDNFNTKSRMERGKRNESFSTMFRDGHRLPPRLYLYPAAAGVDADPPLIFILGSPA
jgi:hypothetical protein